jgi:cobalt-zinc-cadmium efflux system outer membrane protein
MDQNIGGIEAARESLSEVQAERASNRLSLVLTLGRAYDTLLGASREIDLLQTSTIPNARTAVDGMENGYREGRYTLLELLDVESSSTQASLRELDALLSFHTSVAIIELRNGLSIYKMEKSNLSPLARPDLQSEETRKGARR